LWTYTPSAPPATAWGDPSPTPIEGILELPRLRFDDAFHVAAADGLVVFGSSADHKVYALDAGTGTVRWQFYTEGPVRMAPTLADGAVFVGSDDGRVYCLSAADGILRWQFRPGPTEERVLGNGQMISLWPVRTGVLVHAGVAYVGAGVFPAEGLYLYALDARTGTVLWVNDTYGAGGNADFSPQGYMLLGGNYLVLPSGRRPPMVFDRGSGRLIHSTAANRWVVGTCGGTFALLDGDTLYNGTEQMLGYRLGDGGITLIDYVRRLALAPDHACLLTGSELVVSPRTLWSDASRQRLPLHQRVLQSVPALAELEAEERRLQRANQPIPQRLADDIARNRAAVQEARSGRDRLAELQRQPPAWSVPCTAVDSLIVTADAVVVGGQDEVQAFGLAAGRPVWQLKLQGRARGLALAQGRLIVSSDSGAIVCYADGATQAQAVSTPVAQSPEPVAARTPLLEAIGGSTSARGYALVLGPDSLAVSVDLARSSSLRTYVLAPEYAVSSLRRDMDRLGLYGTRAAVLALGEVSALPFSPYFANVVVWTSAELPAEAACQELVRVLKPWGGRLVVPAAAVPRLPCESEGLAVTVVGAWATLVRGPLAGAGAWTHQYAEPGNTACSNDARVQGDLGVLWYGEPGPARIPNRHISSAAPLAADGRLFVQGAEVIMAYDSSNGVELWTRDLPGAARAGLKTGCSNVAYAEGDVFVVAGGVCHRLRGATGETVRTYALPPDAEGKPVPWGGFLAVVDGLLLGSDGGQRLVALDLESGAAAWVHQGKAVDWITLAVHGARVFGVDRRANEEQRQEVLAALPSAQRLDRLGKPVTPDVRIVFCLDLRSGRQLWESPQYVSDCIRIGSGGGELVLMAARDVVLLCGQPWNGHFWQEFYAGDFSRRSLIAMDAATGRTLWSGRKGYRSRPLIVGETIVAEPWAYDLRTGSPQQRIHPLTASQSDWQFSRPGHHCGNISACANGLFFRSGAAAYYDLRGDYGTVHFGGLRPGCWINCIPANGVVLMPEASSGCVCNYALHCTTVFTERRSPRSWGTYSAAGPALPLRRLALNLGAPGDRRDDRGLLWLACPRPAEGRMVLPLKFVAEYAAGGGITRGMATAAGDAQAVDWIDSGAGRGLTRLRLPVLGEADGSALYTVRVRVRSDAAASPGTCQLGLTLQGHKVADSLDLVAAAGGAGQVLVREFAGIRASDQIDLGVTGPVAPAGAAAPPPPWLVTAVEVVCEKVLHVGLAVAPVWINDATVEGHLEVQTANRTDAPFRGTLRVTLPAPLAADPDEQPIQIEPEELRTVPVALRVAAKGPPATVQARVALVRSDGSLEEERTVAVDYLANRGRLTVTPVADAQVQKGTPVKNYGPAPTLAVDGGATQMEDSAHALAFLRFPVQTPGKPLAAKLRLYVPEGGHTQSSDSGTIRLAEGPWAENTVTYANMPALGAQVADLGKVDQATWAERALEVELAGRQTLDLVIVPRSTDGATYCSREGPNKPELVIEYTVEPAAGEAAP
jgi:outer membrane protein assembly factor BamB